MNKVALIKKLKDTHTSYISYIDKLADNDYIKSENGKWSAQQQTAHLIKCIKPLMLVFVLPKFVLALVYGTSKKASRTYEELVTAYQEVSVGGGVSPKEYEPPLVVNESKAAQIEKLKKIVLKLTEKIDAINNDKLEYNLIPHPTLGKITIKEMMYFTAFHVAHHQKLIQKYLSE